MASTGERLRALATEAYRIYDCCGWRGAPTAVRNRVAHSPRFAEAISDVVAEHKILEIGGPSSAFRPSGLAPVYDRAASVDNINYAGATLWESDLTDGGDFAPEGVRLGTQWLREASELDALGPYDAIVSSHTIEHLANPLGALRRWQTLTSEGGSLVLVLPHRDGTFDHRRPVTTLEHLREDEAAQRDESDTTHVEEILSLHDVARDPGLESAEQLRLRVRDNLTTRAMHHHVFTTGSALAMVEDAGWTPVAAEALWPLDIVILARNGGDRRIAVKTRSPFPSDR